MKRKTKRTIQIIGGEMRDIEENECDVTAAPPGSELIAEDTMKAVATMMKRKLRGDEDEFDIEDGIITTRGLLDSRKKKKHGRRGRRANAKDKQNRP